MRMLLTFPADELLLAVASAGAPLLNENALGWYLPQCTPAFLRPPVISKVVFGKTYSLGGLGVFSCFNCTGCRKLQAGSSCCDGITHRIAGWA